MKLSKKTISVLALIMFGGIVPSGSEILAAEVDNSEPTEIQSEGGSATASGEPRGEHGRRASHRPKHMRGGSDNGSRWGNHLKHPRGRSGAGKQHPHGWNPGHRHEPTASGEPRVEPSSGHTPLRQHPRGVKQHPHGWNPGHRHEPTASGEPRVEPSSSGHTQLRLHPRGVKQHPGWNPGHRHGPTASGESGNGSGGKTWKTHPRSARTSGPSKRFAKKPEWKKHHGKLGESAE